ncbi:MAG: hypothetical protein V2B19_07360 [Pseudomonadota bacterium]
MTQSRRYLLIYALADAALVVSSDYKKGGTWTGAAEQLDKLRLVPVYVRSNGETGKGLDGLRHKGALLWPNPETPGALAEMLLTEILLTEVSSKKPASLQKELLFSIHEDSTSYEIPRKLSPVNGAFPPLTVELPPAPAEQLFAKVPELIGEMKTPRTEAEVAADLRISKSQAKEWLHRLVKEGVLEKLSRPVRYKIKSQRSLLE